MESFNTLEDKFSLSDKPETLPLMMGFMKYIIAKVHGSKSCNLENGPFFEVFYDPSNQKTAYLGYLGDNGDGKSFEDSTLIRLVHKEMFEKHYKGPKFEAQNMLALIEESYPKYKIANNAGLILTQNIPIPRPAHINLDKIAKELREVYHSNTDSRLNITVSAPNDYGTDVGYHNIDIVLPNTENMSNIINGFEKVLKENNAIKQLEKYGANVMGMQTPFAWNMSEGADCQIPTMPKGYKITSLGCNPDCASIVRLNP